MSAVGWLPTPVEELFGPEATAEESYEVLTVDVPPATWLTALRVARDELGCTYFDWLSAVDEPGTGFRVAAHVAALAPVRRLLLRTTISHETPALPTAVDIYAGAAWHERETHEMFGVTFEGHPSLTPLLLPETFEGHPLRKDFVLAARVAKAWPGAKEPGESEHGGPKRRQMLPPGVPDPNEWGPLKGQLPPAPARAARTPGERPPRATTDRPARRARSVAEGSASQAEEPGAPGPTADGPRRARTAAEGSASQTEEPGAPGPTAGGPRRARTEGSASQSAAGATEATDTAVAEDAGGVAGAAGSAAEASATGVPRRTRTAAQGSAGQTAPPEAARTSDGPAATTSGAPESDTPGTATSASDTPGLNAPVADTPAGPRRARSASDGSASLRTEATSEPSADDASVNPAPPKTPTSPRSSDAPWHHARPAFGDSDTERSATSEDAEPSERSQRPKAPEEPGTSEEPAEPAASELPESPQAPDRVEDADQAPDTPETGHTPDKPAGGPQ